MKMILLAGLLLLEAGAEDWSRFRGPNGSGVSSDTGFPTQFSREKNVVWRTPARAGKSSPILTANHVFLTAFEKGLLYTQCFDRRTGKLLWERSVARPREETSNKLNEPASITPVTDGRNVYVFFKEFGLLSYDEAGNLRWKTPLGPFVNTMGLASSPILAGDSLILEIDQEEGSFIAAFQLSNGEIRWKTDREELEGWATPLLYRSPEGVSFIVTASRGQLGAHSIDTGKRIWTLDGISPTMVASPILHQDTIFLFGYGSESPRPFSRVLAQRDRNNDGLLTAEEYSGDAFLTGIAKLNGNRDGIVTKEKWDLRQREVIGPSTLRAFRLERDTTAPAATVRPRELWRYDRNFTGVIPSPLLYSDVLYVVKNGGILTSFDPATGTVHKAARLEGAIGGYSASPVAAEGRIFLPSEDGSVVVVKAAGNWEVLAVNELGEGCYASPALSGGDIYLRTTEALYRFGSHPQK